MSGVSEPFLSDSEAPVAEASDAKEATTHAGFIGGRKVRTVTFVMAMLGFVCLARQNVQMAPSSLDTSMVACTKDTGGTCLVRDCFPWRGPTKCIKEGPLTTHCLCQDGYCAGPDGICHKENDIDNVFHQSRNHLDCWKDTGGTCKVLDCYDDRGPTVCNQTNSKCLCKMDYCAREDGRCYRKGMTGNTLVKSGIQFRNADYPTYQLYAAGCGENTADDPAILANGNQALMLDASTQDKGAQSRFSLYELVRPIGNPKPMYFLKSEAFPECIVTAVAPWQAKEGKDAFQNTYKTAIDERLSAIEGPLSDGLAWSIKQSAEDPKKVQVMSSNGLIMSMRPEGNSDTPTFYTTELPPASGGFWTTNMPLPQRG